MGKQSANPAPTPALSKPRLGENGFKYRQQFGLVLTCRDEAHQQQLYDRLVKQGMAPKVVCV